MILISDWWLDDPDADLKVVGALRQEIVAVMSPRRGADPALGAGETRCGCRAATSRAADRPGRARGYKTALADWQDRLRRQVRRHLGRYLVVRSDASLERLLLQDWRRLGLIS